MPKSSEPAARSLPRAKLAQDRSRETQRKIVKAAIALWTSRGFDEGYDNTSVEEIADSAGVTRGTVYYYFKKKEEILQEIAWLTAESIYESAIRALMTGDNIDKILEDIVTTLAHQVLKSEKPAVRRVMESSRAADDSLSRDMRAGGLTRAFSVVITHAQDRKDIPANLNSSVMAEILASMCTSCISQWTQVDDYDLEAALRGRAVFLLAGARAVDCSKAKVLGSP